MSKRKAKTDDSQLGRDLRLLANRTAAPAPDPSESEPVAHELMPKQADPLADARKFVRENPLTAEREGVDVALGYAAKLRRERTELAAVLRDLLADYKQTAIRKLM